MAARDAPPLTLGASFALFMSALASGDIAQVCSMVVAIMSKDHFEFVPGPGPRSLRIIFRGFWDMDVVVRYRQALQQRAAAGQTAAPVNRVLLDLRDCTIQSQDVMGSFEKIIEAYAARIDNYGMLLPASPLLRIQMKRLMLPMSTVFFDTEEEALAWL